MSVVGGERRDLDVSAEDREIAVQLVNNMLIRVSKSVKLTKMISKNTKYL